MQYFGYGSNLLTSQMNQRCPDARAGHIGELAGWRFLINERGVATIKPDADSTVFGQLWNLGPGDVVALDGYEGVATGNYERRILHIVPEGHDPEPAIVYIDPRINPGPPRQGYIEKVLTGAAERGLPENYQQFLQSFRS